MEKKKKRTKPINKPPKDVKLNQIVRARVRTDQKEFVKVTADEPEKDSADEPVPDTEQDKSGKTKKHRPRTGEL